MKVIDAQQTELNLDLFKGRNAIEADFDTFIQEDCVVKVGDDLRIVYRTLLDDTSDLVETLHDVKVIQSKRQKGMASYARTVGFLPRRLGRLDACHLSSLAFDDPQAHQKITALSHRASDIYEQINPALHDHHYQLVQEKVLPDYQLADGVFTSGIFNRNNPIPYHFDAGNFPEVWSCMLGFRHEVEGGFLAVPELGLGFEIGHNSVFMFDGQGLLHGVSNIKLLSPRSFRYTLVFYSMQGLWKCLPLDDELIRLRKTRTERERRRATED